MSVQNEKLIEEARAGLAAFDEYWGAGAPVNPEHGRPWELIRGLLSVFEKAHAHECEMCRWENGFGARKPLTHTCEKNLSTDDFPHGHPEMDPTDDAQLLAALTAYEAKAREQGSFPAMATPLNLTWFSDASADRMRAALRAAGGAR